MPNRAEPGTLLRELRVNLAQLSQNLKAAKAAGYSEVDISADAFGLGAEVMIELALANDFKVVHEPAASSQLIYGFDGNSLPFQLVGEVIRTKVAEANSAVSYGYIHRFERATNLALVGLGFCDGIPRAASTNFQARVNGKTYLGVGRIAMDQVVLDTGLDSLSAGDEVEFFSSQFSVADWAREANLKPEEILLHVGPRVDRVYLR